jgi:hypothetical protein
LQPPLSSPQLLHRHHNDNTKASATGFSIFVDDTHNDDSMLGYDLNQSSSHVQQQRPLEREMDRRKENTGDVERWNQHGGLLTSAPVQEPVAAVPTEPSFPVYMDKDCIAQQQQQE